MIQLVAVTCLSLAAKVEETHVPFLLDLQVCSLLLLLLLLSLLDSKIVTQGFSFCSVLGGGHKICV
jgi:hypothetical protein